MKGQIDGKNKLKALKISAIAIFSFVIIEVTVGFLVNRLAIMSDGLHALLDAFSVENVNEFQLRNIVNDVAKNIARNLRIKRVLTYSSGGKRYINIDCCFTKQVRINDAHKIASLVEKETKEYFADVVFTVHFEPECP